jgi:hypothetical protein
VFGVTLKKSLEVASIAGLPAIVFRCIEYLETMKADQEEGIYRLRGSSIVIKKLKDKFNSGMWPLFEILSITRLTLVIRGGCEPASLGRILGSS